MSNPVEVMDEMDVRVLSSVSANPVGSLVELARLSRMTLGTFSERMRLLGERGILYPVFAQASVSYSAVGLSQVVVLADVPPVHRNTFEAACDTHPYAQYRIRCLGRIESSNFFCTFSVPAGAKSGLIAFLETLQQEGVVTRFATSMPLARVARTEYDFNAYDFAKRTWKVDWKQWEYVVETASSRLENLSPSVLHLLDSADMKILRLLSMDARQERRKIADKVGIRDYDLSRRLGLYLKRGVIEGYRVIHDRNIAGYALTVAVSARVPFRLTEKLFAGFSALPFPGIFFPLEKGFIFIGNVPPAEVGKLSSSLEQYCERVELSTCDYASSARYHFDSEPSNYKEGYGWIDSREYMVEEPMAAILALKQNLPSREKKIA